MPGRKSFFKLIIFLALIFSPFAALTPQLFKGQGNIEGTKDFFEMSLEELMTIEVACIDESDLKDSTDFFQMPLEELMEIDVG